MLTPVQVTSPTFAVLLMWIIEEERDPIRGNGKWDSCCNLQGVDANDFPILKLKDIIEQRMTIQFLRLTFTFYSGGPSYNLVLVAEGGWMDGLPNWQEDHPNFHTVKENTNILQCYHILLKKIKNLTCCPVWEPQDFNDLTLKIASVWM